MTHRKHEIGVAKHIGRYSDAVSVAAAGGTEWLFTSGTPGLTAEGGYAPDFATQAKQAWVNIMAALSDAAMSVDDIVKVTTSLVRAEDIAAYAEIRSSFLKDARPAFMLAVVQQLVWPELLIEVEIVAAKHDRQAAAPG
jgi:enamine deaminase RidA (YjgF/YER057c/UK114 family)